MCTSCTFSWFLAKVYHWLKIKIRRKEILFSFYHRYSTGINISKKYFQRNYREIWNGISYFFDSNSLSKLRDFYKMWQIKIYFKFGEGSVAIESISSEICCRNTIEHAWCTCYIRWKKHSSVAHIEHNFCWLTFQSTVLHLRLSPRRLLFSSFLIPVNVEQWKQ